MPKTTGISQEEEIIKVSLTGPVNDGHSRTFTDKDILVCISLGFSSLDHKSLAEIYRLIIRNNKKILNQNENIAKKNELEEVDTMSKNKKIPILKPINSVTLYIQDTIQSLNAFKKFIDNSTIQINPQISPLSNEKLQAILEHAPEDVTSSEEKAISYLAEACRPHASDAGEKFKKDHLQWLVDNTPELLAELEKLHFEIKTWDNWLAEKEQHKTNYDKLKELYYAEDKQELSFREVVDNQIAKSVSENDRQTIIPHARDRIIAMAPAAKKSDWERLNFITMAEIASREYLLIEAAAPVPLATTHVLTKEALKKAAIFYPGVQPAVFKQSTEILYGKQKKIKWSVVTCTKQPVSKLEEKLVSDSEQPINTVEEQLANVSNLTRSISVDSFTTLNVMQAFPISKKVEEDSDNNDIKTHFKAICLTYSQRNRGLPTLSAKAQLFWLFSNVLNKEYPSPSDPQLESAEEAIPAANKTRIGSPVKS